MSDDLSAALAGPDYQALIAAVPYAGFLGLSIEADPQTAERRYRMAYRKSHIGNAVLPALHGGTLAGALELSMQFEALIAVPGKRLPDPVDFTIDYWRSAGPADCWIAVRCVRSGRRIAQLQAECWQTDRLRPVAFARTAVVLRSSD